jgi:hypothetical protein
MNPGYTAVHRWSQQYSGSMSNIPTADHPVGQLTTSELLTYIARLRAALQTPLIRSDRDVCLERLGKAYQEANERGIKT